MNGIDHDVRVEAQVIKSGGKVRSRRFLEGGYEHYHLRLFIEGDVDALESVEYLLHPTFHKPRRVVTDSANGFALDIWTWGEFDIKVTFRFKDGTKERLNYPLAYSDELPAEDSGYIDVGPDEGANK